MITAIIDAGQHYCQAVSDLWQWDYGQTLRIQGVKLPAAVEVQFSTTERIGETVTRIGMTKEGVTEVPVPDTLLEGGGTTQDYTIYAFVYIENGDSGKTEYRVSMKVRARPKPEAHATPEEGELFRQAIVAVAESADRAESAKNAAEAAAGSAQASADEAKTAKENAEAAAKVAEAFKTEAEAARSEAVRAATESTDAKDSAEKSRAAAEKAKQDAVQAKEAAEKAKSGTAADREVTEAASKAAQVSAVSAEKSAERAETAKEEIQESADQIQKNATEIDSLKENKIEKPAETPTIGKIIRVKSVNEDGQFVCEWADSASELDVRIDGKSIVQDGVAEIPKADTNTHNLGLIRVNAGNGFAVSVDGTLNIIECTDDSLKKRYARIVSGNVIDYAVKAAMCDGKGAAWTSDEQAAARERIGITDFKNVVSATLEEESLINITLDKDGNTFDYDETYIRLIIPKTLENISASIVVGDFTFYVASITNASWNMNYFDIYAKRINGIGFCEYISHTNAEGNMGYVFRSIPRENIRKFHKFGTYKPFPAGTKIIMYAR